MKMRQFIGGLLIVIPPGAWVILLIRVMSQVYREGAFYEGFFFPAELHVDHSILILLGFGAFGLGAMGVDLLRRPRPNAGR